MIEHIYNQLRAPRSFEELYERLKEEGLNWNRKQLELFIHLDTNIKNQGDLYFIEETDSCNVILNIIDKLMDKRPAISVRKIMEHIPADITVTDRDIIKIAGKSGRYKSPNDAVIMKI
jgi:hypothetical protein